MDPNWVLISNGSFLFPSKLTLSSRWWRIP
jgi:hypothetical protein